jgi:hypothetical protein
MTLNSCTCLSILCLWTTFSCVPNMKVRKMKSSDQRGQFCEPGKWQFRRFVIWSWRQAFLIFVAAVEVQGMLNHAQPLSVISYYNKDVRYIQIILTFLTHSSVTTDNYNHVNIIYFTQNNLQNNILKLRYKVTKHSVYSIHIHDHDL